MPRLLLFAVGLLLLTVSSRAAAQKMTTCVEVKAANVRSESERRAVAWLVRSELERHRTHTAAVEDCQSTLLVEVIDVGESRYLTGRINWQVPHRVEVDGDLADAVSELLRVVLHNDPVRLRGPGDRGFNHALRMLKHHSLTLWGIEAFQTVGIAENRPASAPGIALRVRRELMSWHVGVRASGAFRIGERTDALTLRGVANLSFEVAYFFTDASNVSGYLMGLGGVEHHWFTGPTGPADPSLDPPVTFDDANSTGLAFGLRGGVELFRFTTTRMDLFAQATIPAFVTRDEARLVVDRWFPTLSAGVGAVF